MMLLTLFSNSHAQLIKIDQELITQLLEKRMVGFSSFEHQYLGDKVILRFFGTNTKKLLHLPNGLKLRYGQIIMLAGDIMGDPKHPISRCEADKRKQCFRLQFEALAGKSALNDCYNPRIQAQNLIQYFTEMELLLSEWRASGKADTDFYKKFGATMNKKLNRLTCGGSFISDYIPYGNYLRLSQANFDHFSAASLIAYKAGHQVALETALQGYQEKIRSNTLEAEQLLELAYAQNAFANHFLSDAFSSGHIRTPRAEMAKQIQLPAILNLLLANIMHDEDNRLGINVVNEEGSSWTAYGDNYLFENQTLMHRTILLQAMQRSANAVYHTFVSGNLPEQFTELKLVPLLDKIEQLNQTAPLFKIEQGRILKRKDNLNPYNFEWTKYWSGLMMLLAFEID